MVKRILIVLVSVFLLLGATTRGVAADPARYRTSSPDLQVRQVPTEIQQGVFSDPERFLEPLVRFLVSGGRDDFHRVKILHDWIADTIEYDVESYFSSPKSESSGPKTLQRRRGVCHGYGSLMEQMCTLAGIPCRNISGYGRGYGFATGQRMKAGQENHAWNAVYIDERWHLVDVTWDAGHVQGRSYRKEYRTTYLFMEPRNFIFTHLPGEAKWQLLASPLTTEQFERLPFLRGGFFDHGLQLATRLARVTRVGESVQFAIGLSQEVEFMARLYTADGAELPGRTLVQREGEQCRMFVTFPRPGRHRLKLYCRALGDTKPMDLTADLDFEATSGSARTFPATYATFGKMRGFLYSPLYLPLATGKPLSFKVRLQGAHDVSLSVGDEPWVRLAPTPTEKDIYELKTTIPAEVHVHLNAKTSPNSDNHTVVIDFSARGQ